MRLNTAVTLLAATLSALLGIGTATLGLWLKAGEARLQQVEEQNKQIEAKVRALDERDKAEESSYKFAREFLSQVKDSFGQSPRGKQMAVATLNIVAQASTSGGGESNVHSRAELPLHMALLIGDPGSLVMLDPQLKHLDDWFDFATADAEDSTRLTAIQALCSLSKKAVQEGRLDRLERCTNRVELLLTYLAGRDALENQAEGHTPTMPPSPEVTGALIAMSRLQVFFTEHDAQLRAVRLPPDDPRDAQAVLASVRARYETAVAALQEVSHQLTRVENTGTGLAAASLLPSAARINKGYDPDDMTAPIPPGPNQRLQRTHDQVDDALQAVSLARQTATASVASSQPKVLEARKAETEQLISELLSDDPAMRHHGHFNLALLRQTAVSPMVACLQQHENQQDVPANRLRLGVAIALSRMVQPIILTPDEARLTVGLIGAKDADTRAAATEFLVDLDNAPTVGKVFTAIQLVLADRRNLSANSDLIRNAATILGSWVRLLPASCVDPEGQPFRKLADEAATRLKDQLRAEDASVWGSTVKAIDEQLRQAKQDQAKPIL